MPTLNLADVAADPDFAQAFTVYRSQGTFQQGGFVSCSSPLSFYGSIQVPSDTELMQVPEGDRVQGMMLVITTQRMYETYTEGIGTTSGLSDKLKWRDQWWKVVKVRQDLDYGFFKAIISRQEGT
jgi:hypothetical protein